MKPLACIVLIMMLFVLVSKGNDVVELLMLADGGISILKSWAALEYIALIAVTYLMLQGRKMGFYLLCALATADTVLAGMTLKYVEIFQVIANIVKIAILRLILQGSWKDMR